MTTVAAPTRTDLTRFPIYVFARPTEEKNGSGVTVCHNANEAQQAIERLSGNYTLNDITIVNCEDCRPITISLG